MFFFSSCGEVAIFKLWSLCFICVNSVSSCLHHVAFLLSVPYWGGLVGSLASIVKYCIQVLLCCVWCVSLAVKWLRFYASAIWLWSCCFYSFPCPCICHTGDVYWACWPPLCGATLWHWSVGRPLAVLLFRLCSNFSHLILPILGTIVALHQLSLLLSPGATIEPYGHVTHPGILGGQRHVRVQLPLVRFAGMS